MNGAILLYKKVGIRSLPHALSGAYLSRALKTCSAEIQLSTKGGPESQARLKLKLLSRSLGRKMVLRKLFTELAAS